MRFFKKGTGIDAMNYAEALDEALCYGWIDGQARGFDERSYLQRFTPAASGVRGRKSIATTLHG